MLVSKNEVRFSLKEFLLLFFCGALIGSYSFYKFLRYRRWSNQVEIYHSHEHFLTQNEITLMAKDYANNNYDDSKRISGMLGTANRYHLERLIKEYNPQCIVEIGVYAGLSAILMGIKSSSSTKIYAIDPWNTQEVDKQEMQQTVSEDIYAQFLANIKSVRLGQKILPVRTTSKRAAQTLNVTPDFVYVDGDHSAQGVFEDVTLWYSKMAKGGVMCGDDYHYCNTVREGLHKALDYLVQKGELLKDYKVHHEDRFWWLDPKN